MIDTQKHFSLLEEFNTANKLIHIGFGELQNINGSNSFYFLPFQLLSQGFERLMKAYICAVYFERNQYYPSYQYLKNLGHDLIRLLQEILDHYYDAKDTRQFIIDYKLLKDDKEFLDLLFIISEFGKYGRYHNFDIITGHNKPSQNAVEAWNIFENKLIKKLGIPLEKIVDPEPTSIDEVYGEIVRYIIIKFENFVSGLARQIIFGIAGTYGKQTTAANIYDFGMMYADKFGLQDYRQKTTNYRENLKIGKPFTLIHKIKRSLNSKVKYKTITKDDYKGDWPFYVDKVTVQCERKTWCTIIIENKWYSLNGLAKGRYKLENPHDAGMAVIGKSIGDFISIARSL